MKYPEKNRYQRIVDERSLRGHCDRARYDPACDQRIDERILMVDRDQQRSRGRDSFLAHHTDISVEPMERNSCNPLQHTVNHFADTERPKLSGTFRSNNNASIIPIATVTTPAR